MIHDPIGDLLARIKNASMARRHVVPMPYSRIKHEMAKILVDEGFLTTITKEGTEPKLTLTVTLKYQNGEPVLGGTKRVSKPGLRWYVDKHNIPVVIGGMGIAILSTPQGLMTGKQAKKRGIGGEVLCEVW